MIPIQSSLHDIIVEIHELDRKLHTLEEKYSLLSADFYQLYESGQLSDETIEEIDELGRWAAWYRIRARRMAQYETVKDDLFVKNAQQIDNIFKPFRILAEAV